MNERKIIQISVSAVDDRSGPRETVYALADDGSIWAGWTMREVDPVSSNGDDLSRKRIFRWRYKLPALPDWKEGE